MYKLEKGVMWYNGIDTQLQVAIMPFLLQM